MSVITVYKAKGIGNEEKKSVSICITDEIPEMSVLESSQRFKIDAQKIFEAMLDSLPGGTLSKLYAIMAMHYSNNLHIATERLETAFAIRSRFKGGAVPCDFTADDLSETNIDRFLPLV